MQYWEREKCGFRSKKLVSTEEPESLEYIKRKMDVLNAETPDKAYAVADAVVVWRCVDCCVD